LLATRHGNSISGFAGAEMVNWFHPPLQTKVELRAGDTVIAVVRSARQLEPEQLHISIAPLPLPCP